MPRKTVEETHIDKINLGIKKLLKGTITPQEAGLGKSFTRLKELNINMYYDLMNDYKAAIAGAPKDKKLQKA